MKLVIGQIAALDEVVEEFADDFEQWVKPSMEDENPKWVEDWEVTIAIARNAITLLRKEHNQ